jgi:hypothetical protein
MNALKKRRYLDFYLKLEKLRDGDNGKPDPSLISKRPVFSLSI